MQSKLQRSLHFNSRIFSKGFRFQESKRGSVASQNPSCVEAGLVLGKAKKQEPVIRIVAQVCIIKK